MPIFPSGRGMGEGPPADAQTSVWGRVWFSNAESRMPEPRQEENLETTQAQLSPETVDVRIDSGVGGARPLSQFILAKRSDGISVNARFPANIEPIRPVVPAALTRPVEVQKPSSAKPARRHSCMRVEYPFYDSSDEPFELEDESGESFPNGESPAARTSGDSEASSSTLLSLSANSPTQEPISSEVTLPEPSAAELVCEPVSGQVCFISPNPLHGPQIYAGSVSADETAIPLLCDRGRTDLFPILRYYLAAETAR